MARRGAPVLFKEVRVQISDNQQGFLIKASYLFRGIDHASTAPVVLDAKETIPEIEGITCPTCEQDPWMSPGRHLLMFPPSSVSTNEDRLIQVLLQWRPTTGAHPVVLVVPEGLPSVLSAAIAPTSNGSPPPLTSLDIASNNHGLCITAAPIRLENSILDNKDLFLQVVLVPEKNIVRSESQLGSPNVLATSGFAAQFSRIKLRTVFALTQNILAFLGAWFEARVPVQALLALERELLSGRSHPYGLVLTPQPWELGGDEGTSEPADFNLAFHSALIWWGLGCRIHGPEAAELEAAIAAAVALEWVRAVRDGSAVDRSVARFRRFASRLAVRDFWSAAGGGLRMGKVAKITLALHQAIQDHSGVRSAIVRLTKNSWGRVLEQGYVLSELGAAGATISLKH